MKKKPAKNTVVESWLKDALWAALPSSLLILIVLFVAYRFVNPAPPKKVIISAGHNEGGNDAYAQKYKDIMKKDGIELEIRDSKGTWENLKRLEDPKSDVDVGFVQDGLGNPEKAPHLSSLGSLYYEPIWVFYRGTKEITRFSQLLGKTIAIGEKGSGTHTLARRLFRPSGIDEKNTHLLEIGEQQSLDALKSGQADAALFLAVPQDPLIQDLIRGKQFHLMSVDQAEAVTRIIPFLHHLVLPHGSIDLAHNLPERDVDLVAPTATLLVRDSLHPALVYLLLKAATQVHGEPGLFEKKHEFPIDKNYQFPLNSDAKNFYKSGVPFWQKYLPFWLAILIDRFVIIFIPLVAVVIPIVKLVPRIFQWRVKSKIYQRYGELKFLETQISPETIYERHQEYIDHLDSIEERVNRMKIPLGFSDYVYSLRGHIHLVREKIHRLSERNHSALGG